MKNFADFETHEQEYAVNIMRAKFDCKKTRAEWLKAAIAVNPFVTLATFALPDKVVEMLPQAQHDFLNGF